MCPPDGAEQRIHLQVLPCLRPQQEHVLWDTERGISVTAICQRFALPALSPPCSNSLVGHSLTQLVKVSLSPTRARHRADQPGLEEGTPLVHQHPLATSIILGKGRWE